MRIAIAVHGRFHAFDVARELLGRGHEVLLVTNYPQSIVERFGIPRKAVCSLLGHGVATRIASKLTVWNLCPDLEPYFHRSFGRQASEAIRSSGWDVVMCWSGVGEEVFLQVKDGIRICQRGSAHIRVQDRLLAEEEERTGLPVERPGTWIVEREEREYGMADIVIVPSTFAKKTFVAQGFPDRKIVTLPLGVDGALFRPERNAMEEKCRRIIAGGPLRVAYVGTLSMRKGAWDLLSILRSTKGDRFEFTCVGPVSKDARPLLKEIRGLARVLPPLPLARLPSIYASSDVFVLPTLEDGYAMVLDQARAAGLPVLCTPHCSGSDTVLEGKNGWILPIRTPDAFVEKLKWCDKNRESLAAMARDVFDKFHPRSWRRVAEDLDVELTSLVRDFGSSWRCAAP